MADFNLGGLLSGGGGLYDDLLTPQQQSQLSSRGLLSMAGAFADAAMPSRLPIPLGAALGKAAAAMGSGRDEAALSLLKAGMTAQEIKALRQKMALNEQISPLLLRLAGLGGAGGAPAAGIPAGATSTAPAAPAAPDTAPLPAAPAAPAAPMFAIPPIPSIYGNPPRQNLSPYTGLRPAAAAAPPALLPMPPAPPAGRITPADYGVPNPPDAGSTPTPDDPAAGASLDDRYRGVLALAGRLRDSASGSSLPPPDELIRQGSGPGGLLQASYTGAPPFGPTPGASGDEVGSGGDTRSPEYLAKRARDLALVEKYESGGRNIEQQVVGPQGGYNPSVGRVTGPSSASGYRQMINSTWRSAAGLAGIDTAQYPRAIDAPRDVQTKAAEALYDQRGLADWAPYNRALARAVGWSGPMGDGGGSGGGAAPLATPAGAGAALATPSGGVIPGIGMTAQQLGALNALTKMGGLGDPFNSLLETYYKSPTYLGEAAGATKRGELNVELELKPKLEAAIAWAKIDPNINEAERKAQIDRYSKQLEQIGAAQTSTQEAPVIGLDGKIVVQKMTQLELTQKRAEQAARAARGDTAPRPGDIAATPYSRPGQAEQETAAGAPQHIGPTDTVVYPPGSVGASRYQSDKMRGKALPDNVTVQSDGSVRVSGGYTPGQVKTQESAATNTQTRINSYQEAANAAQSAKTTLQGISGEIGKVVTGPFADYAQNASLYLNTIAPGFSGQVKAYEDMASQANELVRKAVRASDPNPSFVQTRMAMDSMPIPSKSEGGLYKITNRMIGLQDHDIARGNATQMETPGGAEKFDSWWRQNVSPYAFVFAKLAPDDRDSLINTLQKTAQGKRELETIGKQLQFIEQHGGFGIQ